MANKDTQYFLADIDTLIPYARNARTHSDAQIAQIAASIKEFGFLSPIIIAEDNTILCGHGRFYGAKKLGLQKVPCVMESHLTETQRRAYIISDNKLSLFYAIFCTFSGLIYPRNRVNMLLLKGENPRKT